MMTLNGDKGLGLETIPGKNIEGVVAKDLAQTRHRIQALFPAQKAIRVEAWIVILEPCLLTQYVYTSMLLHGRNPYAFACL